MIGTFFEDMMKAPIEEFARRNAPYFDKPGPRRARKGNKVSWEDIYGNKHDLDYVLERNGSDDTVGKPAAFIELAWRRYTKHSKNKVQEISGAIEPIAERFYSLHPFKGAMLCGEFTQASIKQLESQGFKVLYIPYKTFIGVFAKHGIDIYYDEMSDESEISKKIEKWHATPKEVVDKIRRDVPKVCSNEITSFMESLDAAINRQVRSIVVLPLHGDAVELTDTPAAIKFINSYTRPASASILKYIEIIIKYSNSSDINCRFTNKKQAIDFLKRID